MSNPAKPSLARLRLRPPAPRGSRVDAALRRHDGAGGLRVTQFSLLSTLARNGPQRITELAALALLDRTALSRNLEPLAAEGLVRIAAGRDARTREVSLTRAGEAALGQAPPYWRRAQVQSGAQMGQQKSSAGRAARTVEELHPAPADRDS